VKEDHKRSPIAFSLLCIGCVPVCSSPMARVPARLMSVFVSDDDINGIKSLGDKNRRVPTFCVRRRS